MKASLIVALVSLCAASACLKPRVVERLTNMPAIPFVDEQVLLMDVLPGDVEVCVVNHAYTKKVAQQCAPLRDVRGFIERFTLADAQ